MLQELEQLKQCRDCKQWKLRTEFHKLYDSVRNICKICNGKAAYKYKQRKKKEFSLAEYLFDRAITVHHSRRYQGKLTELSLSLIDIENQLIKQNYRCYWTNVELKLDVDSFRKPSVDRLDNNKGYTSDNIVITIWAVNRMRGNLDIDSFKLLLNEIYQNNRI